ncbi:MAG: 5-formyltetrahydrofolate cyclo-ligase [bacterium]
MKSKGFLRKKIKRLRDNLTAQARKTKSIKIRGFLYQDDAWKNACSVMIYYSCRSEVLTEEIIQHALTGSKEVLIPCVDAKNTRMIAVKITDMTDIADRCAYGMLQPKKELCTAYTGHIDLIIVPGIVFDTQGGRIGSGKGYFDAFLALHPHSCRIGLAYACQVEKKIDQAAHDVRMHKIITEEGTVMIDHEKGGIQ